MHVKSMSAVHTQTLQCEASASLLLSDCKSRGNANIGLKKKAAARMPQQKKAHYQLINSCGGLSAPVKENAPSTDSFNGWAAHTNRTVR